MKINAQQKTDSTLTKSEVIRKHVLSLIDEGLGPQDKLPTERELAEELSTSRMTVRQVLKRLEFEGLVYSKQGAGTFVRDQRISKSLELSSFSEDMRLRRLRPGSRSIQEDRSPAGAEIGFALTISPRDEVTHFHRIRTADDIPICVEDSYIPSKLVPGIAEDALAGSLYEILERRFSLRLDHAEQTIRATVLDSEQARQLDSAEFSPAFEVTRITFDVSGRRVEYARSIYRGDRYSYSFTVYRSGDRQSRQH
ncbi:MAG: GntR family transcriptional regulator [Bifidobacterium sp.]|uniref:GntR family transcriptional regulator n=1 Tax=Bifidobacterium fermentum TaxID=3059035 RepID=A0AB39UKR0_9BIFI